MRETPKPLLDWTETMFLMKFGGLGIGQGNAILGWPGLGTVFKVAYISFQGFWAYNFEFKGKHAIVIIMKRVWICSCQNT